MKIKNLKTFNFEGAIRGMRNPMNSWNKSDSWAGLYDFRGDKVDYEMADDWADNENNIREELGKEPFELGSPEYENIWEKYLEWINKNMILSTTEDLYDIFIFGPKDLELAQRLIRAGGEHRKFLRQIFISFDLTAPLYFWKEFDTYKIGTTANSTSTMHKLASTPITKECFELENLDMVISSGKNIDGEYEFCFYDYFEDVMIACEELRLRYNHTKDKKYWKALIQLLPESWLQTRTITMNYENVFNIIHQRSNHKLSEWNWLVNEFKALPYANELLFLIKDKENEN